jgi:hypothetical protein
LISRNSDAYPAIARNVRLLGWGRLSIATRDLAKKLFSIQIVQELIEFIRVNAGFELKRVGFHDEGRWIGFPAHNEIIPASGNQVSP